MEIEQLEQFVAVIVTAGLVAGNFLLFTPWRDGEDPRRHPESLIHQHSRTEQTAHLNPNTDAPQKADSKRETERITI